MLKQSVYDSFKCLADKCDMTCCKGWSIKVEQEDFDKWKNNEVTHYLCGMVKKRSDDGFNMKLEGKRGCVMLDECGLCEIVKRHGEEFLSKTCAEFPRKHNVIREYLDEDVTGDILLNEYSLSGACPGVLELLYKSNDKAVLLPANDNRPFPFEYKMRNMIIDIFQETEFDLIQKFLLAFSFLQECIECEWEEEVYNCIEVYRIKENLFEKLQTFNKMDVDAAESLLEICQTYIDMTEFYKDEEMYSPYLTKLVAMCENIEEDFDEKLDNWQDFVFEFKKYDEFFTKVMTAEIFADCISDDIGVMIEGLQIVFLEYLMTRTSIFFLGQIQNSYSIKDIYNYLALFIRMLGHNLEGMSEYWEENFEDSILSLDYLLLISK